MEMLIHLSKEDVDEILHCLETNQTDRCASAKERQQVQEVWDKVSNQFNSQNMVEVE